MDGNFILITVLIATMLGLGVVAFAGPSPEKAQKRRVAMIRGRHSESAEALLEARMRRVISNRSTGVESKMLVSLIPNPENLTKRLKMTGKKWTLSQYMTASAVIFLMMSAMLMMRGFPFLFAIMVGLAAGLGLPHCGSGG
jgi:tight adherence protein B